MASGELRWRSVSEDRWSFRELLFFIFGSLREGGRKPPYKTRCGWWVESDAGVEVSLTTRVAPRSAPDKYLGEASAHR
jgi:hypothetical protein